MAKSKTKKSTPAKKSGITIGWFGITATFVILFILFVGLAKSNNEFREENVALQAEVNQMMKAVETEEAL